MSSVPVPTCDHCPAPSEWIGGFGRSCTRCLPAWPALWVAWSRWSREVDVAFGRAAAALGGTA